MEDDVPEHEKRRRFHEIELLQRDISTKKMSTWLDRTVEVLVERRHKGRWRGRMPQGKLVFFDDERELKGKLVPVHITYTGPWSMSGMDAGNNASKGQLERIPLSVI